MEFVTFFVVACMFLVPFALAGWVLAPLDRMARQRRVRYQFALIDYLGLVLLIQIPMAVWHASVRSSEVPWQARC